MGDTFEEQLAWEVHDHEIEYLREKHHAGKPTPGVLELHLKGWEQLKAEYEKFMAKKAALGSQGGEAAAAAGEREGENQGTAETGKANEVGKEAASLSWADF
jgi:hypothetical protein